MSTKINELLKRWPQGTVATQTWLNALGISRKLANWYVKSDWLKRLGPRAYVRPDDKVGWSGGLYAMQTQLKLSVHVGACSALELQGLAYFVPMGMSPPVTLVSTRGVRLPSWFVRQSWQKQLSHRRLSLFDGDLENTFADINCGAFSVVGSAPERAVMETICLACDNDSLEQAHLLMRGLTTLRPSIVQELLESCRSVKTKRFFLWSAQTMEHPWLTRVDLARVDQGKGKRMLYRNGVYDAQYQITVPPPEKLPDV